MRVGEIIAKARAATGLSDVGDPTALEGLEHNAGEEIEMQGVNTIDIQKLTSSVGAVVEGLDLRKPLEPDTVKLLGNSLAERGVLFFRNQDLSSEALWLFVENFGTPRKDEAVGRDDDPRYELPNLDLSPTKNATATWHHDTTFLSMPPKATALRAVKPKTVGGDTCWASMYAAYDALSPPIRDMLDGLTAIHSARLLYDRLESQYAATYLEAAGKSHPPECVHPVIQIHPVTGRKALYVNEAWTARIVELTSAESAALLRFLFEHVKSPNFSVRWKWSPNDLAFWDNSAVQHFAVADYQGERVMQRVVLDGDRPYGPKSLEVR